MNFNSFDYLFFFSFVYLIRRGLGEKSKSQNLFLLLASFVFYAWWSPIHVLLLIYSGLSDYYFAKQMSNSDHQSIRRRYLTFSILNNLSLLFIFKYLNSFCQDINELLAYTPIAFRVFEPDFVLPVGISFFTFQTMSYAFDVYRKHVNALDKKVDFMLYVAFFPQLVAGPILRAKQFVPQLTQVFSYCEKSFFTGVFFILYGLFKKNCIADPLGIYFVDPVYNSPSQFSSLEIIFATYAYGFQLYNDFSGYSDIAIGSALILGFKIPINFDAPFLCRNPVDFWNRWHISLGHWVRDYVFYPFHSMKFFKSHIRFNLFLTLVIVGVWHGPRWTYLLFGVFHGLLSVLHSKYANRLPKTKDKNTKSKIYSFLYWFVFWNLLSIGFWLFRSNSLDHALQVTNALVGNSYFEFDFVVPTMIGLFVCLLAVLTHMLRAKHLEHLGEIFADSALWRKVMVTWLFILCFLHFEYMIQGREAFIYFQF